MANAANSSVPNVTQSGVSGWEAMANVLAEQNTMLLNHIAQLTKLLDDVIPNERRVTGGGCR